ncbi:MAG: GIY-YIG nuclease family protein [Candidatus Berkelbacteria bacterium]
MKYFVYMLENKNGRHYIGITTDLARRLSEHNNDGAKSTRPFGPWKMIYSEHFDSRSEACKREWYLKNFPGRKEKLEIIKKFGEVA